jgi:DNA repair protein RecN (Recombination protein N)
VLETLRIKNLAVIDSAEVPFQPGLNILSGETGAGKSIVIEAISLLLGSRASAELVRTGCDEALVEGLFDIREIAWIRPRLERLGLEIAGDELLVRRTVHRSGKHRIHINGQLATLSILQQLCEGLVDLCGQHEHQSLIRPATQLDLLDRYGNLGKLAREFGETWHRWRALHDEREQLQADEAERSRRADFLKFQLEELRAAALEAGEDERLAQEKQLLQSAEGRVQLANAVHGGLDDEDGALNTLRALHSKLRQLAQLDGRAQPMLEGLDRAIAEVEEACLQLDRYLCGIDLDPERLSQVQERLALLADLRRKYGASVTEMLETQARLEAEYAEVGDTEGRLARLDAELVETEKALRKQAKELAHKRRKAAKLFSDSVTGELKDLRMGDAVFTIELTERADLADWTAAGADQIQFVVQTNRGEAAKPLGKVASGGELSRLMLAIRRTIADRGGIGVYLFDEIDAGIGGQTAFQVGKKLKSVAKYNQVICITHLPQVASFADHHLNVQKGTQGKRTVTEVVELRGEARKQELARMLGGPELTRKSLENAAELLEMAR